MPMALARSPPTGIRIPGFRPCVARCKARKSPAAWSEQVTRYRQRDAGDGTNHSDYREQLRSRNEVERSQNQSDLQQPLAEIIAERLRFDMFRILILLF